MAVDLELRKAFAELQKKMMETQTQMRFCDSQIEALGMSKRKSKLTQVQLEEQPKDTRLYWSVGRAFFLKPHSEINDKLKDEQKAAELKIKELESKKQYLDRSVKSSEENLREMVSNKRRK